MWSSKAIKSFFGLSKIAVVQTWLSVLHFFTHHKTTHLYFIDAVVGGKSCNFIGGGGSAGGNSENKMAPSIAAERNSLAVSAINMWVPGRIKWCRVMIRIKTAHPNLGWSFSPQTRALARHLTAAIASVRWLCHRPRLRAETSTKNGCSVLIL